MKYRVWLSSFFTLFVLTACTYNANDHEPSTTSSYAVLIDSQSAEKATEILAYFNGNNSRLSHAEKIIYASASMLGTPYLAHSLVGGSNQQEELVVNLLGVDCFTLLDYVEALSRSKNSQDFLNQLAQVRYVGGRVEYASRRHFFTDWSITSPVNAIDITESLTPAFRRVEKQLNKKSRTEVYVAGLGITPRTVSFVPTHAITPDVISKLHDGDYVGIYSPAEGLDVTHVGILVRHSGQVWFRNASSLKSNMKVVDAPFMDYLQSKAGIVVLRAKDSISEIKHRS